MRKVKRGDLLIGDGLLDMAVYINGPNKTATVCIGVPASISLFLIPGDQLPDQIENIPGDVKGTHQTQGRVKVCENAKTKPP